MALNGNRCTWVHDSMMVDATGKVYACCHHQPGVVGNINQTPLKEIFNGERIKQFRQQEIDGTLACAKNCTLRQNNKTPKPGVQHDYHQDLDQLLIEFGEFCNLACVMCGQDHDSRVELDPDIVVSRIEIPKSAPRVIFYGGEPLILKSALAFFDHCAQHDTKVSFITNGTAITEEMADKIARHCRGITFSLNAATSEVHETVNVGSKFDRVLRNIKRVARAKQELNSKVSICGHMTIVVQNIHEVPQFIGKRVEFGFEYVNFSFDRTIPEYLAKNPDLKAQLKEAVTAAIRAEPSGTPATWNGWSRIDAGRLRALGLV